MRKLFKNNAMLLLFFVSSAVVLVISILASRMMLSSAEMIEDSIRQQISALSEAASMLATGDELDRFMVEADMSQPEYQVLKEKLDHFTQNEGIMFTYYMRLDPQTDKMQFIIDNVLDPDESDGLGSLQVDREQGPDTVFETDLPYVVDLGDYSTGWDGLLTAWAPVHYADGTTSNMVAGVDMQDVYIKAARDNTNMLAVVLLISMIVVLATCFICLTLYQRKAKQSAIASQAKSSFLSRMSHEMRTPMNAIIGLSDMARRTDDRDKIKEHLDNIGLSSQHLRHVIDDILDISKIESGKMELEFIPVELRKEVGQIADIIRPQSTSRGQDLTVEISEDAPAAVYYDTTHIRQIVINLLSNAIKFTPEGGKILLSVSLAGHKDNKCGLLWRVKDNGIGIDQESQRKLFEPFEQGDASTTRKYGGTGLGLAISKQLVEMMGGHIHLESQPGGGSEFIFDIWLQEADLSEVAREEECAGEEAPNLRGREILLVEDAEINQIIATDMLEGYGATVTTADDGRAGLDAYLAAPDKYALIFMDIQMPVMDGYEATQRIRASATSRAKTIPIIAMTANVFKEDVEKAFAAGMNGHVGKPFEEEQIRKNILAALASEAKGTPLS